MKTFDNAGNIAPNHVSIWIWYIQFSYNITLYLTVLCRAAPALNQNLMSRAGAALTPIFRLRAALQVHIWHSERPSALNLYMVLRACPAFNPYFAFRAPLCSEALNTKYGPAFNTKYSLKAGGGALRMPNMGWKRGTLSTPYIAWKRGGALNAKYGLGAPLWVQKWESKRPPALSVKIVSRITW